ncbi:MAG: helix-turn-helix domain-containing protein [Bacteroidota bacterium]
MDLDLNWINLTILFGAVQGLIFGIILLLNKKHPGARFLAIFMLVLSFNGFETFSWSSGLDNYILFFDLFGYVTIYALGPSLYWYVRSLLYPIEKQNRRTVLLHYIPAFFQCFVCIVFACLYFLLVYGVLDILEGLRTVYTIYGAYGEPLSIVAFTIYLYYSFRLFNKTKTGHTIPYVSKKGQKEAYQWIKTLLILLTILAISWPLTVLAPYVLELDYNVHYYPIEITLVMFIYWIGFAGYHRMKLISIQAPKNNLSEELGADPDEILKRLKASMENEKVFLNPQLTRYKLATHTGIDPKLISATLNQHAHQSFNDFVNHYRIEEVCENMLSSKNQHLTLSGIALASGFNSQATFQRVFKNVKGMSPKEYLNLEIKKMG